MRGSVIRSKTPRLPSHVFLAVLHGQPVEIVHDHGEQSDSFVVVRLPSGDFQRRVEIGPVTRGYR